MDALCFRLYQIYPVQRGRGRELHTPGTRPWSWRKSSTSTGTWRAGGGSRSPMPSASLSGRSRSGSRTGGWSGRKTTSSRAWAWQQLVAEATGLDIVLNDKHPQRECSAKFWSCIIPPPMQIARETSWTSWSGPWGPPHANDGPSNPSDTIIIMFFLFWTVFMIV